MEYSRKGRSVKGLSNKVLSKSGLLFVNPINSLHAMLNHSPSTSHVYNLLF
jgi:hypothetical protein